MCTLQASLICKHSFSQFNQFSFVKLKLNSKNLSVNLPLKSRFCRHGHRLILAGALSPENVSSTSDVAALSSDNDNKVSNFGISEISDEVRSGDSGLEGNGGVESEAKLEPESESEEDVKKRLPIVVFMMGLYARFRKGFEKVLMSDWFNWWPFWPQEKQLEKLIAEADGNPLDAAKQSALLAQLNKHRSNTATSL